MPYGKFWWRFHLWRCFIKILKYFSILLFILFNSSVYAKEKVSFYLSKNDTLWGIKRISIAEFKNQENVNIQIAGLLNKSLKKHHFFQIAELNDKDHNITKDDFNDITKSNTICETLQVDALIIGKIIKNEILPDQSGIEEISKQIWTGEYERDVDGNIIIENIDEQQQKKKKLITRIIKQPYKIRAGTLTILFNLIDGPTHSLAYSKTITKNYDSGKVPKGEFKSMLSSDKILYILANEVIEEFIAQISPELHEIKRAIESEDGFIDEGKTYAIEGFWDKAIEIWKKVEEQAPNNPKALYNLGLACEALGEYTDAEIYYRKALLLEDKKSYKKAIKNIHKARERKDEIFNKEKK